MSGWEIGRWDDWMKWGAIIGAGVFGLMGFANGWTDVTTGRGFWDKFGEALIGLILGAPLGVIVSVVLRLILWLLILAFGWEIGGWLTWIMWGAIVGGGLLALAGWAAGWAATR
jgi:hypothetical protein